MTFLSNSLGNLKEHTILYFSLDPQKTPWGQAHTSAPTKKNGNMDLDGGRF